MRGFGVLVLLLSTVATAVAEEYPLDIPDALLVEPEPRTHVGPLVGHVTDGSALIWFHGGKGRRVGVLHWPNRNRGPDAYQTVLDGGAVMAVVHPDPDQRYVARVRLAGLEASTNYRYAVFVGDGADGELRTNPLWMGSFTTAPPPGSPSAFREVWANPGAGTSDVRGAFYRFRYGDVEFFVLDGRYHRTPNNAVDTPKKTILGEGQIRWLSQSLRDSDATFKVLATGSTLKTSRKDGWRIFTHERQRLFRMIARHRISGVLFLSGDVHRSLVVRHRKRDTGFYDTSTRWCLRASPAA